MRFDWYAATVQERPQELVEAVLARLAPGGDVVQSRGLYGYTTSLTVRKADGDRAARILCGGNSGANPNVEASGHDAHEFACFLREFWPIHKVTRCDSAHDVEGEGLYETMLDVCRSVARERGVKGILELPDDVADGRTYYIGSASSDVRTRLYEKTAELRKKLPPERHDEIPDNWVRIEAQVRPRKEAGYVAASLTPEQVWGCSGWSWELARRLFALDVSRVEMQAGREPDHRRAYRFMLQQYGPTLRRMLADLGSWECVGMTIGDDLARIAAHKVRR